MEIDSSLLGLNKYELNAYEALIRLGKSTATRISKLSNVPQGKIYMVLDSLIKKGLADSIPIEPKEFVPNNPNLLSDFISRKNKEIELIKSKIEQLKWFYKEGKEVDESKLLVRQGKKAFYNIVENLKETKKYDYSIRWTYEFNKEWAKRVRDDLKKNLDIKILTRYDKENYKDVKKWLSINKNIRSIENDGVAMAIQDDKEVMITIIGCNSTILIRDQAFAKLMKKMFLETYNNSRKLEGTK